MIFRASEKGNWPDVALDTYKDEPGTWVGVSRRVLSSSRNSKFEFRIFEIAPKGYTSYEKHQHEHAVLVLEGAGEVFLQGEWQPIAQNDFVHVAQGEPHQFRSSVSGMKIVCVVDQDRDRPVLLQHHNEVEASNP